MNISEFAHNILLGTSLEAKLTAPQNLDWQSQLPTSALTKLPRYPARPKGLELGRNHRQKVAFPKIADLHKSHVRGQVLHFFANHELLAIEIMALALLKFPEAPLAFRQGLVHTIAEEQAHMGLYIARMAELGVSMGDLPVNDFFWHCLSAMNKPIDFVTGMSMTFEQANLDFCVFYKKLFHQHEDTATASLLETVYQDEIRHVHHGVTWFERWRPPDEDAFTSYSKSLRLPLTPARAIGQSFDEEGRLAAGLDRNFINQLRLYSDDRSRRPRFFIFNIESDEELRLGPGFQPPRWVANLRADLDLLPLAFCATGDRVLVAKQPEQEQLLKLQKAGFKIPKFLSQPPSDVSEWVPWQSTPSLLQLAETCHGTLQVTPSPWSKLDLINLRQNLTATMPAAWAPVAHQGIITTNAAEIEAFRHKIQQQWGLGVILKVPHSAAGRHQIRLEPGEPLPERLKRPQQLLAEPLLPKIADLSLVMLPDQQRCFISRAIIDNKGQYRGHVFKRPWDDASAEVRRFLFAPTPPSTRQQHAEAARDSQERGIAPMEYLQGLAVSVKQQLAQTGYHGPFGIDAMIYRHSGCLGLWPLGEVNSRLTMGAVANRLAARVCGSAVAEFRLAQKSDLRDLGATGESLTALASCLEKQRPLETNKRGLWRQGVIALGDTSRCQQHLPLIIIKQVSV